MGTATCIKLFYFLLVETGAADEYDEYQYNYDQGKLLINLFTRKSPLRGDILGVLTHTTALDRDWGGDETLK